MTEHEIWEAGLWYDANYAPEICAEREKAEKARSLIAKLEESAAAMKL